MQITRISFLSLLAATTLVSCSEKAEETPAVADSTSGTVYMPMQSRRDPGFDSANVLPFQRVVFEEYARMATKEIKKQDMDSVIETLTPEDVARMAREGESGGSPQGLEQLQRRADSAARITLAAKYKLTLDSLDAIIERGNRGELKVQPVDSVKK